MSGRVPTILREVCCDEYHTSRYTTLDEGIDGQTMPVNKHFAKSSLSVAFHALFIIVLITPRCVLRRDVTYCILEERRGHIIIAHR